MQKQRKPTIEMKVKTMKSKTIRTVSLTILSLLLGVGASGYAAQEHHEDKTQDHSKAQKSEHGKAKPAQQHAKAHQQPRQAQGRQQEKSHAQPRQNGMRETQARPQQRQAKPAAQRTQQTRGHSQSRSMPEQQRVQQSAWQQHRSNNWQSEHRSWAQRGGYNGYRIPEDRFRGHFGRSHGFRIGGLPFMVVGGYPRFQYEGYWFTMVDPYPGDWSNNWYDTDSVYVTYSDNGYYLYNSRYPGVGIAISVSM
jgi:hypothetical protein